MQHLKRKWLVVSLVFLSQRSLTVSVAGDQSMNLLDVGTIRKYPAYLYFNIITYHKDLCIPQIYHLESELNSIGLPNHYSIHCML